MPDLSSPHRPLTVALSPCPNDTYIFGAWILGHRAGYFPHGAAFVWADVQELNLGAAWNRFDVVKVSAAQALALEDRYHILSSGGAFGLQQGPKLVAAPGRARLRRIAVPGMQTTAVSLLRQAWTEPAELIPMRYDRIVDMVRRGAVDGGLLIHESALLLARYGLDCRLDLGQWWREQTNDLPLPLGCIIARRVLGESVFQALESQICSSLQRARTNSDVVWPLVQALAQEPDSEVLHAHIKAYVNEYSHDMGHKGRAALNSLAEFLNQDQALTAGPSPV
jgi:1,4-dihydroxy-6-naphthoate synthase